MAKSFASLVKEAEASPIKFILMAFGALGVAGILLSFRVLKKLFK